MTDTSNHAAAAHAEVSAVTEVTEATQATDSNPDGAPPAVPIAVHEALPEAAPHPALAGALVAPTFSNPQAFTTVEALQAELARMNAELLKSEQLAHQLLVQLRTIASDMAPVAVAFMRADWEALVPALHELMKRHVRVVDESQPMPNGAVAVAVMPGGAAAAVKH